MWSRPPTTSSMLEKIGALPGELGAPETLLADAGYFSAANVAACAAAGIAPLIAMGRQPHHPPLAERFEKAPSAPDDGRSHGASAQDAGRQEALRPAQT